MNFHVAFCPKKPMQNLERPPNASATWPEMAKLTANQEQETLKINLKPFWDDAPGNVRVWTRPHTRALDVCCLHVPTSPPIPSQSLKPKIPTCDGQTAADGQENRGFYQGNIFPKSLSHGLSWFIHLQPPGKNRKTNDEPEPNTLVFPLSTKRSKRLGIDCVVNLTKGSRSEFTAQAVDVAYLGSDMGWIGLELVCLSKLVEINIQTVWHFFLLMGGHKLHMFSGAKDGGTCVDHQRGVAGKRWQCTATGQLR